MFGVMRRTSHHDLKSPSECGMLGIQLGRWGGRRMGWLFGCLEVFLELP